jgi:hypothetical protein
MVNITSLQVQSRTDAKELVQETLSETIGRHLYEATHTMQTQNKFTTNSTSAGQGHDSASAAKMDDNQSCSSNIGAKQLEDNAARTIQRMCKGTKINILARLAQSALLAEKILEHRQQKLMQKGELNTMDWIIKTLQKYAKKDINIQKVIAKLRNSTGSDLWEADYIEMQHMPAWLQEQNSAYQNRSRTEKYYHEKHLA